MKPQKDIYGVELLPFYPTQYKLVKSGCLVEVYKFGKDIFLGQKIIKNKEETIKPKITLDPEETLKSSARRAKRMIKRLIYANSFNWLKVNNSPYLPITITLTFAENIQDLKIANYEFTKFIRRLNYETNKIEKKDLKQSNLKYLAVFELQRRGAIHYHCIFFNMPYINKIYDRLADIWGQGMINVGGKKKGLSKIKDQTKLRKIIDYFIKYIQKSIFENSFPNKKKYITSKGLLKPREQYFKEVISLITNKIPGSSLIFNYDGEQKWKNGTAPENYLKWMNYWQYDLSALPDISKAVDEILDDFS